MKLFFIIYITLFLLGCQSTLPLEKSALNTNYALLKDDFFTTYDQIETQKQIFALDENIKQFIHSKLLTVRDNRKRAAKLLNFIFNNREVTLAYQSSANLTASETFHTNKANCLSLTIMAYALAKEAKLDIRFQQVNIPEFWVRNKQYNMLTGHVNLLLITAKEPSKTLVYGSDSLQIDFDPYIAQKRFNKQFIDKNTVIAMFYNNKGAQAIVDEQYHTAYAYFKAAVVQKPDFSIAWSNLALLYRINHLHLLAKETYQYALELNNNNLTALANYAILLTLIGEINEANKINQLLYRKRQDNPYYQALLADEAFYRQDYKQAVKLYKKAIELNHKAHEFYFGLAKTYYKLALFNKSKRAMKKAIALNKIESVEHQYIAKLNFLNALKNAQE